MNKVAVVMGSKSDLPVVEKAINVLKDYHIQTEVRVLSAHRCPNEAREFAASAREGGFSVIIAAAGMAAHLAGALAANTTLPVSGIPVATVAIDGAKNAALLAIQILAVSDPELARQLDEARAGEKAAVLEADAELQARFQ